MSEMTLRKWHRRIGITLALFIILQAGSGLLISFSGLNVPHEHEKQIIHEPEHDHTGPGWLNTFKNIHHGGGPIGNLYRIIVGIGAIGMAASGTAIFYHIKNRMK
ncbi:MAG: hypothetical protein KKE17_14195 [Proteobacteria bacterium]|nr:hypothetical protein [Pseudomonadota bacterium]MBU1711151.1 hypothetical protein [Pseudomonadota bacterium]